MKNNYEQLSEKYSTFIFEKYDINYNDNYIEIVYYFDILGLTKFTPKIKINTDKYKDKNKDFISYLAFNIGMIELISYWKCVCSKNVIIKCGYLSDDQISFFKKVYYHGLGEFFYTNNIDVNIDDFVNIKIDSNKTFELDTKYKSSGNLIAVGGGKDSNVTLELLKDEDNTATIINPKEVHFNCINASGCKDILIIERTLDKKLIELNNKGFLNGHTPFSSLVSFVCFLSAYLLGKKYIVLSNESSANESTVLGKDINHQYSKSYEYEKDFNNYVNKYFKVDIKYFSLLRCLNELQIALLFSNYDKYHMIFKSCNLGSKKDDWQWCCNCPKCLFTFIMMCSFMDYDKVIKIFGKDLLDDSNMMKYYKELLGETYVKPFECVGTVEEVKVSSSMIIRKNNKLPLLLKYYKDNYELVDNNLLKEFNTENNIDEHFLKIVKEELNKYVR